MHVTHHSTLVKNRWNHGKESSIIIRSCWFRTMSRNSFFFFFAIIWHLGLFHPSSTHLSLAQIPDLESRIVNFRKCFWLVLQLYSVHSSFLFLRRCGLMWHRSVSGAEHTGRRRKVKKKEINNTEDRRKDAAGVKSCESFSGAEKRQRQKE